MGTRLFDTPTYEVANSIVFLGSMGIYLRDSIYMTEGGILLPTS